MRNLMKVAERGIKDESMRWEGFYARFYGVN